MIWCFSRPFAGRIGTVTSIFNVLSIQKNSVIWSLEYPTSITFTPYLPTTFKRISGVLSRLGITCIVLPSRKIFLLLHEVQSGTVGMSVIFCDWSSPVTMGRLTNLFRAVRRNGQSDRLSVVECSIIRVHHIQLQNTKILSTKP
jgi:hypothetical protein